MYSYVVCFSLDDHGRLFDCVSLDELVSAMSAGLTVGHSRGPILLKLMMPKRPGWEFMDAKCSCTNSRTTACLHNNGQRHWKHAEKR